MGHYQCHKYFQKTSAIITKFLLAIEVWKMWQQNFCPGPRISCYPISSLTPVPKPSYAFQILRGTYTLLFKQELLHAWYHNPMHLGNTLLKLWVSLEWRNKNQNLGILSKICLYLFRWHTSDWIQDGVEKCIQFRAQGNFYFRVTKLNLLQMADLGFWYKIISVIKFDQ